MRAKEVQPKDRTVGNLDMALGQVKSKTPKLEVKPESG